MIESEHTFGTTTIYCDNEYCHCEHYQEASIDNLPDEEEACEDARTYGWIIFEEDGEWYHYCSEECKEIRH